MPTRKKPAPSARTDAARGGSALSAAARPRPRSADRKPKQRADATYHHGDLRTALLVATEELLDAAGLESFTLREVARRAGVSHGAPAHHFGDVRGLLSEFTAQSFAQLAAAMATRRARASGAFEQLVAIGVAYVEYALANRARFQLMFRSDRLDADRRALAEAGAEAYGHLVDCVERIAYEAGAPGRLEEKIALAWSIVHGFATLSIDNAKFAEQVARGETRRALGMVEKLLRLSRPVFEAA